MQGSRKWMTWGSVAFIGVLLVYAFWPRPTMVDLAVVEKTHLVVSIDEEAKTRVRNSYIVSAPVAGRLLRVEVEPGDMVEGSKSLVARMLPINPAALDARSKEQARANVSAAEAALRVAQAELKRANADKDLADLDHDRAKKLYADGTVAKAALDRADRAARAAQAAVETARAAISMRKADLENAKAQFISVSTPPGSEGDQMADEADTIAIKAPVSGRILRLMHESETTMQAGTPILEIGDTAGDLEIVAELLSTDAVQVAPGNRVIVANWGGPKPLDGVVEKVEPWGFTKYSALGVEEQRVNTIIRFADGNGRPPRLGHGFRVEVRIVTWEDEAALSVPSAALFREGAGWAVFLVEDGDVRFQPVEIGANNGTFAQVLSGLDEGAQVVLYPGPELVDGAAVAQRTVE